MRSLIGARNPCNTSAMWISIFCLFLCMTWQCRVAAMYFYLTNQKPMCFIEEVPDITIVKGTYKISNERGTQFSSEGVHFEVTDPDTRQVLSRTYTADGHFVFTSHRGGEYRVCTSTNANERVRVHLDFAVGEQAINYGEVATKDRLNEFELRIRQLQDQVQSIAKDQNYQRVREEYFRQLSESTSHRVTYWSLGQLILLCAIGFWQMRHLRAFFQAKKLV